ncbi:MAG: thiamine-phosphate kinase [Casimicrobiaceae bacterium]
MNEFQLIERFFARPPRSASVRLGIGDDAALLAPAPGCEVAVSVDMLVAGRHFFADVDPEALGHKTLAVNLSDLAAMGATPRWALLAGALPDADEGWLAAFARGFLELADAHAVDLVGGDTTRGPLNLCVTIIGEVPAGQALRRDGARAGDDLYVSGSLGDAALAVAARDGRVELTPGTLAACRARLDRPQPRTMLGTQLRTLASSAIDLSDGLTGDLDHILARSGVGAEVELARLPTSSALTALLQGAARSVGLACLLAGGDDYELCFTAPVANREAVGRAARAADTPVTRVGSITATAGLVVRDERGAHLAALPGGFDHFGGGR